MQAILSEKANVEKMSGPPGLDGFGDVGQARLNFNRMSSGMIKLKEIADNVQTDPNVNTEELVQNLAEVVREMFLSTGSMFQQEYMRFANWSAVTDGGGYGAGGGGGNRPPKAITEYKIIKYLRAVNGDKSLFRQWHQKFTTALGQVPENHEEIIQRMVKEIDLGKELEKVVITL